MYLCSRCGRSYSHDRSCSRHEPTPPTPTKLWPASLKHGLPPPSIQPGLPGLLPTPPLTPTKLLPAPHPALQSGLTAPLPTPPTNVLPAALQHGLPAPLIAHPTKLRPAALLPLNSGLPAPLPCPSPTDPACSLFLFPAAGVRCPSLLPAPVSSPPPAVPAGWGSLVLSPQVCQHCFVGSYMSIFPRMPSQMCVLLLGFLLLG